MACKEITVYILYQGHRYYHSLVFPFIYLLDKLDIEEYKKLARNKIEADSLTKQVRDVIKITKWQKQDMREGFKETFKPLIKSQDSIKKVLMSSKTQL